MRDVSANGNYILRIENINNSLIIETVPYEYNNRDENINTQILLFDENENLIDKDYNSGENNFSKLELII